MLIRNSRPSDVKSSEITGHSVFLNRRRFLETGAAGALALSVPSLLGSGDAQAAALPDLVKTKWGEGLELTDKEDATKYNNFYELSTDKEGPARMAHLFKPKPWKVTVDGEVAKSGEIDFDDLIKPHKLEERIYRLRCVEAWSMVIPWVGIPLGNVLKRFEPTSKAKYVAFETLVDEKMMPGVRYPVVPWPYREGLRMDEAMNPLALLAVGMYGEELLPQNGAPIRLVVPWKYGFKSIKSIIRITLTEKQPPNSWNMILPNEYGFYANVNPNVDHPRWSQANERRIGHFFRQETLMFNGYGEEVAHLYEGMDLRKNY